MSGGELALLAVFGAFVALDAWPAVHSMISRPIVVGPVVGWVLGSPVEGALWGAAFEVLYLGLLPAGAARYPEAGLAALVGTATALVGSGAHGTPTLLAVGVALAVGEAGQKVDGLHRRLNGNLARRVSIRVAAGNLRAPGWAVATALVRAAVFGAFQVVVYVVLVEGMLRAIGDAVVFVSLPTAEVKIAVLALAAVAGARRFLAEPRRGGRVAVAAGIVVGAIVASWIPLR